MYTATPIFAQTRGRTLAHHIHSSRIRDIVYLDVLLVPETPIGIGSKVQIHTLEQLDRTALNARGNEPKYIAHHSDIEGTVTGIRTMEADYVELILKNEDKWSATEYAYLAMAYEEGLTVALPWWVVLARWLLRPFLPNTRRIPLEDPEAVEWDDL
ncbi:hypothetical protein C8Q73DRAFT_663998 [Cubamyces lactineus]|nr:hypothetical protein C8Q73DRAFT_663998 [Cubamyces lactineus]